MSRLIEYSLARDVAERVYSGKCSIPAGWELDTSFNPNAVTDGTGVPGELNQGSGFYAYALRPTVADTSGAQNARILAIRGTERKKPSDLYAVVSDIGKSQFSSASLVINSWLATNLVAGRNIELIGHSLGGALVQWAANDTNLVSEANATSVLSIGRNLPDPNVPGSTSHPKFAIKPSRLHFYTFNAPGITRSPGAVALSDKTSVINGEHHVIALKLSFPAPILKGDAIHLLGGSPVGGGVVAHRVNFAAAGHSGWFTHAINRPTWWDEPIDPGYVPPFPVDFQVAQAVGRFVTNLFDANGRWDSELEASVKLVIFFAAAATVGLSFQLGNQLGKLIKGIPVALQTLASLLKGTAKSIGNAFADLNRKAGDAAFEFGGAIGSFAQCNPYQVALATAGTASRAERQAAARHFRPPGALAAGLWAEPRALGRADAGGASEAPVRDLVEGAASAELDASARLPLAARRPHQRAGPFGRCPPVSAGTKKHCGRSQRMTVVFQDEAGFTLHPRLGFAWAKGGARLRVPTTSQYRGRRTDGAPSSLSDLAVRQAAQEFVGSKSDKLLALRSYTTALIH